jgi:dTDP-4-amino-4,6-dideoxygalactose transaminase
MRVSFLDLRVTDEAERRELLDAVDRVLRHGRILLGPEVDTLEDLFAEYCGTRYAIMVSSGTEALFMAIRALDIGPGDEVITTPLSFIATANGIALNGATPVFADVREDLTIDPSTIEALITKRTKAILPVHFTGKLSRMPELKEIADKHGLLLIEDAAPAFGAAYLDRRAGSFGDVACFSMNCMKVFGALGEAGMVVTDSKDIRERLIALRYNGLLNREYCHWVSLNGRPDTVQAAMLIQRLPRVENIVMRRREIAAYYNTHLADVVRVPQESNGYRDVYYTYTVKTERREALQAFLQAKEIETKIQHPILMPNHPAYEGRSAEAFPVAKRVVGEILSLPANEKLTWDEVEYVTSCVRQFYGV